MSENDCALLCTAAKLYVDKNLRCLEKTRKNKYDLVFNIKLK